MKKYISKFHYLTQDLPDRSHVEQTRIACEAGANWIQYRCLSKADQELIAEIHQIAAICDDWGVTLILTNHFHLLDRVDAQGVHMEDMKADFKAIRNQIGEDKTLGGSANTFEDVCRMDQSGLVDYIGLGPFSVTLTKPDNYPLLGIDGYKSILQKMDDFAIGIPILAVGGVAVDDVEPLLHAGVHGLAVSAAINHAPDPAKALQNFYKMIY